jgi:hypothetical protein
MYVTIGGKPDGNDLASIGDEVGSNSPHNLTAIVDCACACEISAKSTQSCILPFDHRKGWTRITPSEFGNSVVVDTDNFSEGVHVVWECVLTPKCSQIENVFTAPAKGANLGHSVDAALITKLLLSRTRQFTKMCLAGLNFHWIPLNDGFQCKISNAIGYLALLSEVSRYWLSYLDLDLRRSASNSERPMTLLGLASFGGSEIPSKA